MNEPDYYLMGDETLQLLTELPRVAKNAFVTIIQNGKTSIDSRSVPLDVEVPTSEYFRRGVRQLLNRNIVKRRTSTLYMVNPKYILFTSDINRASDLYSIAKAAYESI